MKVVITKSRRRFVISSIALAFSKLVRAAVIDSDSPSGIPKKVFAHYMVAWPRGGPEASLDSYQAEFRDAHSRGIDGFALNCGGWDASEPQYKRRVLQMYDAASKLDFDFKLFVSADGEAQNEIEDIISTTAELPAQLISDGRPVVSAYAAGGTSVANRELLIQKVKKLGAYFVPHFFPSTGEKQIYPAQAEEIIAELANAKGFFYFGSAGAPQLLAASINALSKVLRVHGKVFMASVTPYYRGLRSGTNYRAFETYGYSGMALEWQAAIDSGANWVQIVTWNDWAESTYVAPIGGSDGRAYVYARRFGNLPSHLGYLDASAFFICWFKTGIKPQISADKLYYFYRLHPIVGASDGTNNVGDATPPASTSPLSSQIQVTVFLKQPATVSIILPSRTTKYNVPAGIAHLSADFAPGRPRFTVERHETVIIDKIGEQEITLNDFSGEYNYFSGES
ncbi:conserved hypothetical protein [Burkholderia sp. H160]|nr:conserved hypothetical protein [Burkholderia sp. H160]